MAETKSIHPNVECPYCKRAVRVQYTLYIGDHWKCRHCSKVSTVTDVSTTVTVTLDDGRREEEESEGEA